MQAVRGSFRDPAGYVVENEGVLKRIVTHAGAQEHALFLTSGLYGELARAGLVVDHDEDAPSRAWPADAARVLVPRRLRYISYPYEWSFPQLKDAALLTLELQERALARGLSLKDASAYNIQFDGCHPLLIDTLSFEEDRGGPWVAYEQFCRHFLGPLLLMQYRSAELGAALRTALDGYPVAWASGLLPVSTYLSAGAFFHIHLHARYHSRPSPPAGGALPPQSQAARLGVLGSLRRAIERLTGPRAPSRWLGYQELRPHYSDAARTCKAARVSSVFRQLQPKTVYDLGANTGEYSALAVQEGAHCVAFDADPACVGAMYTSNAGNRQFLPLVMDLTNPSPGLGFGHEERMSMVDRGPASLVLALGLVHHLRLAANIPLKTLGRFLSRLSPRLLLEFVPVHDPMAAAMLHGRNAFEDYTLPGLLEAFAPSFDLLESWPIEDSPRTLLLFGART